MSISINVEGATRDATFKALPQHIIVDPQRNGRAFGLDQEKVIALALQMLELGENGLHTGQRTPVRCRRIDGKRVMLTSGNYRHAAVAYINENIGKPGFPSELWKLRFEVTDQSEAEAFRENLIENLQRNQTTIVDAMVNIKRLSEQFGWADERILSFYGTPTKPKSPAWLDQVRSLGRLDEKQLRRIHEGELSAAHGYFLADIPEDKREELLADAKEEGGGKVTQTSLNVAARRNGVLKHAVGLRTPEVAKCLEYVEKNDKNPTMREWAKLQRDWMRGALPECDFVNHLRELIG